MPTHSCFSERLTMNRFNRKIVPVIVSIAAASWIATQPASAAQESTAQVSGPVAGTKMTDSYLQMAARNIYFWAWPMTNVYNRRLAFKDLPEPGLMGGTRPAGCFQTNSGTCCLWC
jgi:hypothetical protein